jgi:hypothetical protein
VVVAARARKQAGKAFASVAAAAPRHGRCASLTPPKTRAVSWDASPQVRFFPFLFLMFLDSEEFRGVDRQLSDLGRLVGELRDADEARSAWKGLSKSPRFWA